ncbi:MAG TPA: hypothetical protein VHE81_13430, partial [Lacipirellulaceae bacterium]|nr:hypothetical protein [Lacipirellulaceae bacterium]
GNMAVPEKAKNAAATAGGADGAQNGAGAQGAPNAQGNEMAARFMQQYDRNQDGVLTADEVPPQVRTMLRGADLNNDRRIDASELQAFSQRMNARMRAWAAGGNPNGGAGVPGDGGGPRPPRP